MDWNLQDSRGKVEKEDPKFVNKLKEKKQILVGRIEMQQQDIVSEKIDNHWDLHAAAIELFSKDICFICETPIIWNAKENSDSSGRMFNFTNSKFLVKDHWCTICRGCLKRKILKETLEEGLGGY